MIGKYTSIPSIHIRMGRDNHDQKSRSHVLTSNGLLGILSAMKNGGVCPSVTKYNRENYSFQCRAKKVWEYFFPARAY